MSKQHSDDKPVPAAKPEAKASTELSAEELDRATGGDKAQTTKANVSDLHFTKTVDKSSPNLF